MTKQAEIAETRDGKKFERAKRERGPKVKSSANKKKERRCLVELFHFEG